MGLDTTHDAWHGPYSSFMEWRSDIAKKIGLGDLKDYQGYGGAKKFPEDLKEGLVILLSHSDCDGSLEPEECGKIATNLSELLPLYDSSEFFLKGKTECFINGCLNAVALNEPIIFQ